MCLNLTEFTQTTSTVTNKNNTKRACNSIGKYKNEKSMNNKMV